MRRARRKFVPLVMGLAGLFLVSKRRKRLTPQQLHRMDFKSSTQKIGVYFPEALRDRLRRSWLRLK